MSGATRDYNLSRFSTNKVSGILHKNVKYGRALHHQFVIPKIGYCVIPGTSGLWKWKSFVQPKSVCVYV